LGESITTARHGLKILSTHSSGPSEIKLWGFLYSEWGATSRPGEINTHNPLCRKRLATSKEALMESVGLPYTWLSPG
jgi:hypothetical protein